MKIEGEVIAVETDGDRFKVRIQGGSPGEADWRPMGVTTLSFPSNAATQKAFYLGRKLAIEIRVKP